MDIEKFIKEFYKTSDRPYSRERLIEYELPNSYELHSMICGYSYEFEDKELFDRAESIDYLKYERQLWKLERWKP